MFASFSKKALLTHVLRALAAAQIDGRRANLDEITTDLGVRRADVRSTLTSLHREGAYDVTTGRLTMTGFAIGSSLIGRDLSPIRTAPIAQSAVA